MNRRPANPVLILPALVTRRVIATASGSVTNAYAYDGLMRLVSEGDSLGNAAANPFRFSSKYADDALGLVYYNYRHYDPVNGRWMCIEPLGEYFDHAFYLYCNNQLLTDLLGLFTFADFKGTPPADEEQYDAMTAYYIKLVWGEFTYELVGEYSDDECKTAQKYVYDKASNTVKPRICPCERCYLYKASAPAFKMNASLAPNRSWVKKEHMNSVTLLAHENLHLVIAQKEAEKEAVAIRSLWETGERFCSPNMAKRSARTVLISSIKKLFKLAESKIDEIQSSYDEETSHGKISKKQEEWEEKYK